MQNSKRYKFLYIDTRTAPGFSPLHGVLFVNSAEIFESLLNECANWHSISFRRYIANFSLDELCNLFKREDFCPEMCMLFDENTRGSPEHHLADL